MGVVGGRGTRGRGREKRSANIPQVSIESGELLTYIQIIFRLMVERVS